MTRRWTFHPSENRLKSDDEVACLTGKAADVLRLLLANEGNVVSRDEILKGVWKGLHVSPHLVREYVFDLRQALGDDAANPSYIETVRGKGFRLIGGVESARTNGANPLGMQCVRIAVLRPDCFDGGPRWQRFADGMVDELLTDLSRFGDLAVIARASSFGIDKSKPFAEIGEALNCEYVLESSISVWGDTLRARFQVIDVRSSDVAWADCVEKGGKNLPQVSGQIALTVANQLGGVAGAILRAERRYAVRRPSSELSAWENYVIACTLEERYDDESINAGLRHIDQAIEQDPEFARSFLLQGFFCEKHEALSNGLDKDFWLERAQAAAEQALALDRRDPLILAFVARSYASSGRTEEARVATFRTADLAPNEPHAAWCAASAMTLVVGDYEAAASLIQSARELCPEPQEHAGFVEGRNQLFSGNFKDAEEMSFAGPEFESTFVIRCLAQSLQGKKSDAQSTYRKLISRHPGFRFEYYPKAMGVIAENTLATYNEAVARLGL